MKIGMAIEEAEKEAARTVTFKRAGREEGVYGIIRYPDIRFISLGRGVVLFVDEWRLEIAAGLVWRDDEFVRLDEDIEITFKRRSE